MALDELRGHAVPGESENKAVVPSDTVAFEDRVPDGGAHLLSRSTKKLGNGRAQAQRWTDRCRLELNRRDPVSRHGCSTDAEQEASEL